MTFLTFIRHPDVKREALTCAWVTGVFVLFMVGFAGVTP